MTALINVLGVLRVFNKYVKEHSVRKSWTNRSDECYFPS